MTKGITAAWQSALCVRPPKERGCSWRTAAVGGLEATGAVALAATHVERARLAIAATPGRPPWGLALPGHPPGAAEGQTPFAVDTGRGKRERSSAGSEDVPGQSAEHPEVCAARDNERQRTKWEMAKKKTSRGQKSGAAKFLALHGEEGPRCQEGLPDPCGGMVPPNDPLHWSAAPRPGPGTT